MLAGYSMNTTGFFMICSLLGDLFTSWFLDVFLKGIIKEIFLAGRNLLSLDLAPFVY